MADLSSANGVSRLLIGCKIITVLRRRAFVWLEIHTNVTSNPKCSSPISLFVAPAPGGLEDSFLEVFIGVDFPALTTQHLPPLSLFAYGPRGLKLGSRTIPLMTALEDG